MSTIAIAASVVLGLAFVLAGASKLALGAAWIEQADGFGVPRGVAMAVPWIELTIGAALVAQIEAPWPAVAAITILVIFTAAIAHQLLAGRRPACACFGAWSAAPIGAAHLARNAVLLALGVVALWA